MSAYDFCNNELLVGDWVAISLVSQTNLYFGIIKKISVSEKGNVSVGVEIKSSDYYSFRNKNKGLVFRCPKNLIKISREAVIERSLLN